MIDGRLAMAHGDSSSSSVLGGEKRGRSTRRRRGRGRRRHNHGGAKGEEEVEVEPVTAAGVVSGSWRGREGRIQVSELL